MRRRNISHKNNLSLNQHPLVLKGQNLVILTQTQRITSQVNSKTCVEIPLLQDIKDVLIYNKFIKEECIKKLGRKRKDSPTINVIGQLANLMLGKIFVPIYLYLRIPIVDIYIKKYLILNTLIDLGEDINVMTKETMLRLDLR